MKNNLFFILLILFFLFVFFIFFKTLNSSSVYSPEGEAQINIPSFKIKTSKSKDDFILSEQIFMDNKYYLLNIWASWCKPCREEHPFLIELSALKNLQILGLNYKDNKKNSNKFLKELGNPYSAILIDDDGTISIEWGAYGVPESFLIYNKKIIKRFIGPLELDEFKEIKRLVK